MVTEDHIPKTHALLRELDKGRNSVSYMRFVIIIGTSYKAEIFGDNEVILKMREFIWKYIHQDYSLPNYKPRKDLKLISLSIEPNHIRLEIQITPQFLEIEQFDDFILTMKRKTTKNIQQLNKKLDRRVFRRNSEIWTRGYCLISKGQYLEPHIQAYLGRLTDLHVKNKYWG